MSEVSLQLFKQHVRADDYADDDVYLQQCLDSAEEQVVTATHRSIADLKNIGGGSLPKSIVQAILLIGGSLYDHRENDAPTSYVEIPWGAASIIKNYRKLSNRPSEVDDDSYLIE